jgi:hypothetical protein
MIGASLEKSAFLLEKSAFLLDSAIARSCASVSKIALITPNSAARLKASYIPLNSAVNAL